MRAFSRWRIGAIAALTTIALTRPAIAQSDEMRQVFEQGMRLYESGTPEGRQAAIAQFQKLLQMAQSNPTSARVGILFNRGTRLNVGSMTQERVVLERVVKENGIEFVDQCPRDKRSVGYPHITNNSTSVISSQTVAPRPIGQAELRGWFVSEKTSPASGLRVVIRNVTPGFSRNPIPFSDREYDKGNRSEDFRGTLRDDHDGKFLAFALGQNDFEYEIKRGNQVVESGKFSTAIDIAYNDVSSTEVIPRPKVPLECVEKKKKE